MFHFLSTRRRCYAFYLVSCVFIAVTRETADCCVFISCPETLPSSIQVLFCSVATQTIRPRANRSGLICSFSVCVSLCLFFVWSPGALERPPLGSWWRVDGPPCGRGLWGCPSPALHLVCWREGFCGCLSQIRKFPSRSPLQGGPGPLPPCSQFPRHPPPSPSSGLPTDLTAWPLTPLPHLRSNRPWTCWPRGHNLHRRGQQPGTRAAPPEGPCQLRGRSPV